MRDRLSLQPAPRFPPRTSTAPCAAAAGAGPGQHGQLSPAAPGRGTDPADGAGVSEGRGAGTHEGLPSRNTLRGVKRSSSRGWDSRTPKAQQEGRGEGLAPAHPPHLERAGAHLPPNTCGGLSQALLGQRHRQRLGAAPACASLCGYASRGEDARDSGGMEGENERAARVHQSPGKTSGAWWKRSSRARRRQRLRGC